jgi:hypothetical protein
MTDRPNDPPAPTYDDRTRDITLPHLPDRPPPALPREWAGLTARREPDAPGPDFSPPAPDTQVADAAPRPATDVEWADRTMLADQPTDEMGHPRATPRERTLAFSHPEMSQRPVGPVRVAASPRRWHWFVLALLPILIIAGAGLTLVLLLRA